jgi:thiol-disulfide isomerase/thioredoxin
MYLRELLLAMLLCLPLMVKGAPVAPGEVAPEINLPRLPTGSENIRLADLRGKVVYVDFWASWCGPCRVSFPLLDAIRTELGPQGFEVLAVNVDEFEEDALRYLDELPVSYLVAYDQAGSTPAAYGIVGMPTGFLVDREGIVRKRHQGFRKSDASMLRAEIVKLLGSTP